MTGSARIVRISVSPGGGTLSAGDPIQLLTEDEALALIGPR
jgi:hypothetical protein